MGRRPKPSRSGNPGCAPIATPWRSASSTVRAIVSGSPAWNPQATFALVMSGITASSSPIDQLPKLSPMSELTSKVSVTTRPPRTPG